MYPKSIIIMVYKIQKVLLTCIILSILLPFIFQKTIELDLGGKMAYYSLPRTELLFVPFGFLILLVLTNIWEKELKNKFG